MCGLATVIEMSRAFSAILLQLGMLVRGGVACGPLIHEDRVIFGPGLVSAYQLESKVAKVARIILDGSLSDYVDTCRRETFYFKEYLEASLRVDTDGYSYIHVLREMEEDSVAGRAGSLQKSWWGKARKTILDELVAARGEEYYDKVEWFARYYNRSISVSTARKDSHDWSTPLQLPLH